MRRGRPRALRKHLRQPRPDGCRPDGLRRRRGHGDPDAVRRGSGRQPGAGGQPFVRLAGAPRRVRADPHGAQGGGGRRNGLRHRRRLPPGVPRDERRAPRRHGRRPRGERRAVHRLLRRDLLRHRALLLRSLPRHDRPRRLRPSGGIPGALFQPLLRGHWSGDQHPADPLFQPGPVPRTRPEARSPSPTRTVLPSPSNRWCAPRTGGWSWSATRPWTAGAATRSRCRRTPWWTRSAHPWPPPGASASPSRRRGRPTCTSPPILRRSSKATTRR